MITLRLRNFKRAIEGNDFEKASTRDCRCRFDPHAARQAEDDGEVQQEVNDSAALFVRAEFGASA
jgi:hypothetical protein